MKKKSRLFHHLKKYLELAVMDYGMIEEGDRVLIAVSGGADSLALLSLLATPMVYVPDFSYLAVHIDSGFDPSFRGFSTLKRFFEENSIPHVMEKSNYGPLAHSEFNRKNPCFLCSRLRRKRLFEIAEEKGCTKIALGHHRNDIIITFLINLFYGREISTMVPKQTVFGGRFHIIRPLSYIREELIKKYAQEQELPVMKNPCPSSETSKRSYIKGLLNDLAKENKDIYDNIWRAFGHVKLDYMLKILR